MNSLRTWEVGADISWLPVSTKTMDLQSIKNFGRQTSVLVALLLLLPIQLSLASQPIPAYSVKKDFWFKTSNILSYLCSSLSAACAAFFWFRHYCFIRYMNLASWFKEVSPPNNWETSIFMLSVDITSGQKFYWTSHQKACCTDLVLHQNRSFLPLVRLLEIPKVAESLFFSPSAQLPAFAVAGINIKTDCNITLQTIDFVWFENTFVIAGYF